MPVHLRIEQAGREVLERTCRESLVTIGRADTNVVQLEDHAISRRHAALRDGSEIMDLGSRNGTFLNGERLEPHQSRRLKDGDVVQVGPFHITVRAERGTTFETQQFTYSSAGASREQLAQAVEELKLLNDLALEIGASHDAAAIMDEVVRRNIEATGAEQGLITLVVDSGEESGEVVHRTMVRTGKEFDLDQQLEAWMLQFRRPFLLNQPREHPVFRDVRWKETLRNVMCIPLLVRGKMTGLLTLYNKRDAGGFTESDERLASIIAAQSAHIIENARLFEEQKKLVRMEQEMQVALDIQTDLMPKAQPEIEGYDVAGLSRASQVVGGDHFDFIPMREGCWAICVGDVSGKGLPAALVMSNLQAILRTQILWSDSVKACMEGANQLLHESTNRRTFVTLFYGVLDPRTHRFTYANAGHNRPLLIGADAVRPLPPGGFVLGGLRRIDVQEHDLELTPGETLLMFSDGVVEARGEDGTLFGDERLHDLAVKHRDAAARDLVEAVLQAVETHAGSEPQADDVTVVALRRALGR